MRLVIEAVDGDSHKIECDGCLIELSVGDKHVAGIRSCCGGGCHRYLCAKCIEAIVAALKEVESKTNE